MVMLAQIAQRPVVLVLLDSVGKFSRTATPARQDLVEIGEVLMRSQTAGGPQGCQTRQRTRLKQPGKERR